MSIETGVGAKALYDDIAHNRLLRLFTIATVFSAIAILSLVGLSVYWITTRTIRGEAERDAVRFGLTLLENEIEKTIYFSPEGDVSVRVEKEQLDNFNLRLQKIAHHFSIFKIKLYAKNGKIVYSTDKEIINSVDRNNLSLRKALSGQVVSELESKRELWDLPNEQKVDVDMVETYLPIRNRDNDIVGAFEVYMDVSLYRERVKILLLGSLGALSLVLICVFWPLIGFMRRASRTIQSKTKELQVLSGLLPICSFCKKIKNSEGEWEPMEEYITSRTESEFSHGFCPPCREKHYRGL